MTIALGLRANDGIVLCADTQQTISGYIKTFNGKVHMTVYNDPRVVVAMARAGTEDYIATPANAF
jgi:20S proteasome alpha/beta subunit